MERPTSRHQVRTPKGSGCAVVFPHGMLFISRRTGHIASPLDGSGEHALGEVLLQGERRRPGVTVGDTTSDEPLGPLRDVVDGLFTPPR
ncbi:hypothetical protein ACWD1Y_17980 [Streptomyces sp. NPDC002814]